VFQWILLVIVLGMIGVVVAMWLQEVEEEHVEEEVLHDHLEAEDEAIAQEEYRVKQEHSRKE